MSSLLLREHFTCALALVLVLANTGPGAASKHVKSATATATATTTTHSSSSLPSFDEFGKDTGATIRLRGFNTQTFQVALEQDNRNGHKLSLVRIVNPKIAAGKPGGAEGKRAVLFVHGILESAKSFVVNSLGARPRNYANLNARALGAAKLSRLLINDGSRNCLPLLLSNFGHDVWLLSRRPTIESQRASGHTFNLLPALQDTLLSTSNLLSFLYHDDQDSFTGDLNYNADGHEHQNQHARHESIWSAPNNESELMHKFESLVHLMLASASQEANNALQLNYWNFSLDVQAKLDLPATIDTILKLTGRKQITLVGHSLGAALPLMMLSERPEYATKIDYGVLFAPALHLGDSFAHNPVVQIVSALEPLLLQYRGAISPSMVVPVMQSLVAAFCQLRVPSKRFCGSVMDAMFGESEDELNMFGGFYSGLMDVTGSYELVQLIQSIKSGRMHYFDFKDEQSNRRVYNKSEAPLYDTNKISGTRLSIWSGNTDPLVTPRDTRLLVNSLHVPVRRNFIEMPDVHFSHVAYLLHRNVSNLVNIPTLLELESAA